VDDQVAAPGAAQVGHAVTAQHGHLTGLRPGPDVELLAAVHRLEHHGRPQRRGGHRHLDGAVQVVSPAREDRVRPLDHLDVQVSRGPAGRADLALPRQLDPGAGVDARGHLDRQAAPRAHPALAGALQARVGDHRAVALAGDARLGGHHLAEERPGHPLHLPAAAAHLAGPRRGAGLAARPPARRTDHGGVQLQLAMERRDRKAALRTVDVLMRLDRRIDEYLCELPDPEEGFEAEREALDAQRRALAREKLILAAETRGPRLAAVSTAWTNPPDRAEASDSIDSVLELNVVAQPGRISRGTWIQVALTVVLGVLAGLAAFVFLSPAGPENGARPAAIEGVSS